MLTITITTAAVFTLGAVAGFIAHFIAESASGRPTAYKPDSFDVDPPKIVYPSEWTQDTWDEFWRSYNRHPANQDLFKRKYLTDWKEHQE